MPRIAILTFLFLAACPRSESARQDSAFQKTITNVADSVELASTEADALEDYDVVARYNPAQCKCPPFEVFAYGRWMRTMFDGNPDTLNGLAAFQAREKRTPSLQTFSVRGRFSDELLTAENQVRYPVFFLVPQ